jgi:hypothetical protein
MINTGMIIKYPIAEKSSLIPCQKVRDSNPGLNAEASRNWVRMKNSLAVTKKTSQNNA